MTADRNSSTICRPYGLETAGVRWPWLSRCVADPEEFIASYWGVGPYSEPGAKDRFAQTFTLSELDRSLAMGAFRNVRGKPPQVRMTKDGAEIPAESFSKIPDGQVLAIDCERVAQLIQKGSSLIVRGVDQVVHGLFELCGGLESELSHRVHANVYLTPQHSRGLTAHCDPHDVIVLQISGSKRWQVFESGQDPSRKVGFVRLDPDARPVIDTLLTPGDTLYIPQGWTHAPKTEGDVSLHVTVGITQASLNDIFTQALNNPEIKRFLDKPLPIGFARNAASLTPLLADVCRFLARELNDADTGYNIVTEFVRLWIQKERRSQECLIANAFEKLSGTSRRSWHCQTISGCACPQRTSSESP